MQLETVPFYKGQARGSLLKFTFEIILSFCENHFSTVFQAFFARDPYSRNPGSGVRVLKVSKNHPRVFAPEVAIFEKSGEEDVVLSLSKFFIYLALILYF